MREESVLHWVCVYCWFFILHSGSRCPHWPVCFKQFFYVLPPSRRTPVTLFSVCKMILSRAVYLASLPIRISYRWREGASHSSRPLWRAWPRFPFHSWPLSEQISSIFIHSCCDAWCLPSPCGGKVPAGKKSVLWWSRCATFDLF